MTRMKSLPRPTGVLPSVTVAIPCYNYGSFLAECLDSVLAQDGVSLEVIVVDDASTDDSAEIAQRFVEQDPRVTLVRHSANQGHITTFNECLAAGSGTYVVKLDADDLLTPGQLARSTAVMEANPSVGFVYGRAVSFTTQPPLTYRQQARDWSVWAGGDWLRTRCRRGRNVILQPEVLMRRSTLAVVGGHRADVPAASDFNLWLRLSAVADVARVNGPDQGCYRVHSGSMQRTIHAGHINDLRARASAFETLFDETDLPIAGRADLRRTASKSLAREAIRVASDAYDLGDVSSAAIADYIDFARALDPDIESSVAWRALARRRRGSAATGTVRSWPRRIGRDLEARLRWRYWQRSGL